MTRTFTTEAKQIAAGLILGSGNGLYSVIREPGITCEVCAAPLDEARGFRRCFVCNGHLDLGVPLADRVGSLVYAIEGDSQVYKIVHNYKAAACAGTNLPTLMSAMLARSERASSVPRARRPSTPIRTATRTCM